MFVGVFQLALEHWNTWEPKLWICSVGQHSLIFFSLSFLNSYCTLLSLHGGKSEVHCCSPTEWFVIWSWVSHALSLQPHHRSSIFIISTPLSPTLPYRKGPRVLEHAITPKLNLFLCTVASLKVVFCSCNLHFPTQLLCIICLIKLQQPSVISKAFNQSVQSRIRIRANWIRVSHLKAK